MVASSRNLEGTGTVICGSRYGNVMASRGSVIPLFVDQMAAGRPITITDREMTELMRVAEKQMRLNVQGRDAQRATTGRLKPGEHLWVYGRGSKPCYRCGTAIEAKKHGRNARLTFWCPRCQR